MDDTSTFSNTPLALEWISFDDDELEAAILEPAFVLPSSPRTVPSRLTTIWFQAETDIINPEPEFLREEEVQTKWHSTEDLKMIKLRAKDLSIELRRSVPPQDTTLTIAHQKTSLMLQSDLKALVRLSHSTPDQDLAKWCAFTDGRRGLESLASRYYNAMRRNDIAATRRAVLKGVRLMQDPETIARSSRVVSRRARTFARYLAVADAKAAQYTTTNESERANRRSLVHRWDPMLLRVDPSPVKAPRVTTQEDSTLTRDSTMTRCAGILQDCARTFKQQQQPTTADTTTAASCPSSEAQEAVTRWPRLAPQPHGI